jgi:gluconolactonase
LRPLSASILFGRSSWPFIAFATAMAMGAADAPFLAKPLTEVASFTAEAEGPACDREGNVFAVSFARKPTIGRIRPNGRGEVFLEMPSGSLANGLRFDQKGMMFVADYTGHNVLRIDPKIRKVEVFAHEPTMNQPNDLAIDSRGTLWASDPDWKGSTGQLWRISPDRVITRIASGMGTTNGIEVSPDDRTLYVNESVQRNVWAFNIQPDGSLTAKRLLIAFQDFSLDGMRCDVDGNLYIARHGKGTVAIVSAAGKLLREVDVLGKRPTNVCFGGKDGRTCYVTEAEKGRIVQFRTERPGLEWQRSRESR